MNIPGYKDIKEVCMEACNSVAECLFTRKRLAIPANGVVVFPAYFGFGVPFHTGNAEFQVIRGLPCVVFNLIGQNAKLAVAFYR